MQFLIDIALSLIYFCAFLLICAWSWRFWKLYVNQKHLNGLNWLILEIKLPREIMKSPYATEVAIASLLQTGGVANWYAREIKGNLPAFASLEIASIEGVIHFYVRIQAKYRAIVESNFYAQYPGIEIVEAEDYTSLIRYDHRSKDVGAWGASFKLSGNWKPWDVSKGKRSDKELSADFLPIKTYVDYELDKNPKEEFKIDPIAPILEFMGSIGKGEHFWYQIILQAESVYGKALPKLYEDEEGEHVSLSALAESYKKDLRIEGFSDPGTVVKESYSYDKDGNVVGKKSLNDKPSPNKKKEMELSAEDKGKIEATNKKFSKPLAVSVIRLLYLADNRKTKFNGQNIFNILSFGKPFEGWNKLGPKTTTDPYAYPWENFRGMRVPWRTEEFFESYVEREGFYPHVDDENNWLQKMEDSFFWGSNMKARKTWRMLYTAFVHPFHHPHPEEAFTLNLEEIATLWHLPGAVVTTPTLPRIDSAKAVAPVNLPQ